MLTDEQKRAREGRVTASFVPALIAGNKDRIHQEWQRLVGDPTYVEPDFSRNWPVRLGEYLEPLVLDWIQTKGRRLIRRGEVVVHPEMPHVSCTLDAFDPDLQRVVDVKVIGSWRKIDDVLTYYLPQLIVQAECCGVRSASLAIVHGGAEPVEYPLTWSQADESVVWEAIADFWRCVTDLRRPIDLPEPRVIVPAVQRYDMTGNNAWADEAATWLENYASAKRFEKATKAIKELMPDDAVSASGAGIECKRSRSGALSIKDVSK